MGPADVPKRRCTGDSSRVYAFVVLQSPRLATLREGPQLIYSNILDAMGNTPLIRLNRLVTPDMADILVKNESLNVGASIKTRTAYQMILGAEERGEITPNTIIVEPTSGNQGVGLALIAAVRGYRARIIMPDSVSEERRKLVRHYGAEVVVVHDRGNIGECIDECIQLAYKMADEDPNVFVPQQFKNTDNLKAHLLHTGQEILQDVDGPIHGFCSGFGTAGTLTGIGQVLRQANPHIRIWAVEPENAAILHGKPVGSHVQMGIGDGLIPQIMDLQVFDEKCIVTDQEALEVARRLAAEEGLMVGISSGSNVAAAMRLARELGPGHTVVTLLPDTAERYFSTELFAGE